MALFKNPKIALPRTDCTGCGACAQLCKSAAITMKQDVEGFLRPVIDEAKCVNCGLCTKRCPVLHPAYENKKNPACYAMWAEDAIRDISSSGGAFTLIAEHIFAQGGVVAGACYDQNFNVLHRVFDDVKFLPRLRGSKYVQSSTKRTFVEIETALKAGRPALYSGTPCQIAGLNAYLGRSYKNLLTVEIICHGVPSHKAFHTYLKQITKLTGENHELKRLNFRSKRDFGWSSSVVANFSDGKFYKRPATQDPYYKAFLNNISSRPSCGTCKFATMPRQADLTIGDFWGIDAYKRSLNDGRGTSILLVNSAKGETVFNAIRPRMPMCEAVPIEVAIPPNPTLDHPFRSHPSHGRFYQYLTKRPMTRLADDCLEHRYDVGVVGLWYGLNYGSILTYFALYKLCLQLGYSALMIGKPNKMWSDAFLDPETIANRFIHKRCRVGRMRTSPDDWRELSNHCYNFVVGSDVVWNYDICGRESGDFFFLGFVKDTCKKISFASSFAHGYGAPYEDNLRQAKLLQRFDAVSVREQDGVDICRDELGVKADKVLDPVFLCDPVVYDQAIRDASCKETEPYVVAYILGPGPEKVAMIGKIREATKKKLLIVTNPNNYDLCTKRLAPLPVVDHPSVEDWLYYFKHTDLYIGDSFHGLCFAIIFRRNFVLLIDRYLPSLCRFVSLLEACGIENHIAYVQDGVEQLPAMVEQTIDYDKVYERLAPLKDASTKWLADALAAPKKDPHVTIDEYVEMEDRVRMLERRLAELSNKLK